MILRLIFQRCTTLTCKWWLFTWCKKKRLHVWDTVVKEKIIINQQYALVWLNIDQWLWKCLWSVSSFLFISVSFSFFIKNTKKPIISSHPAPHRDVWECFHSSSAARPLWGTIGRCEEEEGGTLTHASLLIVANYWVEVFPSGSWGERNAVLRVLQLGFISRRFGSKT